MAPTTAAAEQNVVSRACNVEDVFTDFEARRAGLLKALTSDVVEFFEQCHPHQLNVRLYGLPDRSWELKVPGEDDCELLDIPAPTIGINFARPDTMQDTAPWWIPSVAMHSDSWLLAVAFYYAAKSGFDISDRERLYGMISDVPTLSETVICEARESKKASSEVIKTASENNEAGCEVTTEDEEDGSEDELDCEEDDEVDSGYVIDQECICEVCNRKYKLSDHWL